MKIRHPEPPHDPGERREPPRDDPVDDGQQLLRQPVVETLEDVDERDVGDRRDSHVERGGRGRGRRPRTRRLHVSADRRRCQTLGGPAEAGRRRQDRERFCQGDFVIGVVG